MSEVDAALLSAGGSPLIPRVGGDRGLHVCDVASLSLRCHLTLGVDGDDEGDEVDIEADVPVAVRHGSVDDCPPELR